MSLLLIGTSALAAPSFPPDQQGPHAAHVAQYGQFVDRATTPRRAGLPTPTPGPDVTVYGYQAYWDDDLNAVPWDDLSHIALFAAEANTDGSLSYTSRWSEAQSAVAMAQPYGVRVHLCVINFTPSEIAAIVSNPTTRATLISNLATWKQNTGAHGINIDFEGLPVANKADMVAFTNELHAAVGEVVLATPAVDWSGAWDYDELTVNADLFIMGYGYHWTGSAQAGPNDPLYGGGLWGEKSLAWSVDDYTNPTFGADPDRIILGLPLYGIEWPRSCASGSIDDAIPCDATGSGSSVFYAEAKAQAATHGEHFESGSRTPWYDTGSRQGWYSDADSVAERAQYAKGEGIAGIGFWALHYDDGDTELWSKLRAVTHEPVDPGPDPKDPDPRDIPTITPWTASAGQPVLAYVGDEVVLNGSGSAGPQGKDTVYTWTQTTGPEVRLAGADGSKPRFTVNQAGTYGFELVVGTGTDASDPDEAWVIAIDPEGRDAGCGCQTADSGLAVGALLGLAALLVVRRKE